MSIRISNCILFFVNGLFQYVVSSSFESWGNCGCYYCKQRCAVFYFYPAFPPWKKEKIKKDLTSSFVMSDCFSTSLNKPKKIKRSLGFAYKYASLVFTFHESFPLFNQPPLFPRLLTNPLFSSKKDNFQTDHTNIWLRSAITNWKGRALMAAPIARKENGKGKTVRFPICLLTNHYSSAAGLTAYTHVELCNEPRRFVYPRDEFHAETENINITRDEPPPPSPSTGQKRPRSDDQQGGNNNESNNHNDKNNKRIRKTSICSHCKG